MDEHPGAEARRFPVVRRGYDRSVVDAHLGELGRLRRRDRRELRVLRARLESVERELETVSAEADRAPAAFLSAVAAKQRLLEEATERAEGILRAAYDEALADADAVAEGLGRDRLHLLGMWAETAEAPLVEAPDLTTWYEQRSAQLPSLGPAAGKVLGDVAGLRPKGRRPR